MKAVKTLLVAAAAVGLVVTAALADGSKAASKKQVKQAAAAQSNQQIAEDIAASIAVAVPQGSYSIEVLYADGVATLRGQVASPQQRQAVLAAVKRHPAVRSVRERIRVAQTAAVRSADYQAQQVSQPAPQPAQPPAQPAQPPAQAISPPAPQHVFVGTQGLQYHWPYMPPYSWPAYAPYPNYSAVQYPRCYPGEAWPYIGPFYPYPEPPLEWRSVELKYFAGHWYLKFKKPLYLLRSIYYYY